MVNTTDKNLLEQNKRKAAAYLERFKVDGVLNHINGSKVNSTEGETFETISPIDLKPLANVSKGNINDIDNAAQSAKAAFQDWAALDGPKRKKILHNIKKKLLLKSKNNIV